MTDTPSAAPRRLVWIDLAIVIAPLVAVSLIGGAVTRAEIPGWYAGLDKPAFNPPNWVFAPVWTALYALMGLAAFRILRLAPGTPGRGHALLLHHKQLLLNLNWSLLFFGLNSPGLGLIAIAALLLAIIATILAYSPLDRLAAALLTPYLAWVGFAAALNLSIWRLNG